MQKALHTRTTVQPGGKVEFASPELEAGQTVDILPGPINYDIKHRMGWGDITLTNPRTLTFQQFARSSCPATAPCAATSPEHGTPFHSGSSGTRAGSNRARKVAPMLVLFAFGVWAVPGSMRLCRIKSQPHRIEEAHA